MTRPGLGRISRAALLLVDVTLTMRFQAPSSINSLVRSGASKHRHVPDVRQFECGPGTAAVGECLIEAKPVEISEAAFFATFSSAPESLIVCQTGMAFFRQHAFWGADSGPAKTGSHHRER